MKKPSVMVDYRGLRWNTLNSPQYRHLKLLLFWPVFGLLFLLVERGGLVSHYHVVKCALDDMIPLCEYFLIPYLFWFVFLIGMHLYTLLFEPETFKKFIKYIILTYSVTMLIYWLYPTAQELRPLTFERDNIFTRFLSGLYVFDTNTNVCPSIHVIGSLAVMSAAWNSERFRSVSCRFAFGATAVLICISTVFLKQHSLLDILAALPICIAAYPIIYTKSDKYALA